MERINLQRRLRIYEGDQNAIDYFIHLFLHEWKEKDIFLDAQAYSAEDIPFVIPEPVKLEEQKTEKILQDLLTKILLHLPKKNKKTVRTLDIFFVPNYQDKCYGDIYATYYSGKHFSPASSFCSRFFLFDGNGLTEAETAEAETAKPDEINQKINEAFIGLIVRRPLPGREIGRTLINPKYLFDNADKNGECSNIWKNKYNVTMYGVPLSVHAFPYTMQDGEVATCAETSIMNLLDYYSVRYPDYKMVIPSKISEIVRRYSNTRNLPSPGLTYEMISKVLMESGFSPKIYKVEELKNQFIQILHSYIASSIPVAVGLEGGSSGDNARHSIIIIGTPKKMVYSSKKERKQDFENSVPLYMPDANNATCYSIIQKTSINNQYVVMDDRKSPYTVATIHDNNNSVYITYADPSDEQKTERWDVLIFSVPLGKEMMMDADTAVYYFENLLRTTKYSYITYIHSCENVSAINKKKYWAGDYNMGEKPLMTRIFLCSSRRLKEQRIQWYKDIWNYDAMAQFQEVHLPHFVWVCELYTYESYTEEVPYCVGEIILDATTGVAHDDDSAVVWIQYPGMMVYRHQGEDVGALRERVLTFMNTDVKDLDWKVISPFKFEDKV